MAGSAEEDALRFEILGPLRVLRDGAPVPVGGPKQRTLLALLLLRPNRPLSAGWLADALWDGAPPPSAHVTLRTYVAGLRRALEPGREPRAQGRVIVGHTGGYELRIPAGAVDAERFTRLAEAGARALAGGDPDTAERRYADALALWRGAPPLVDLAAAGPDLDRLAEARLTAEEGRFAAAVTAGRHLSVLPELRRHVAAHPAREDACRHLMLALYRAGRQTEALEVFATTRHFLAGEFGVDPGGPLRDLHRQILRHTVPPAPPPRPAPPALAGRSTELAALAEALTAAGRHGGRAVAIVGEPGIGKTSLATAVAARAAAAGVPVVWGRCPDLGQAPPFWLWAQVVRALRALPGAGGPEPALDGFAAGPAFAAAGGADLDPAARFRTYDAVAELVRAAAAPAGLVIVLDDLHAADPDSLLLLRYLAGTVHSGRALVVATLRPYEHDAALVAVLADLAREAGGGQLRLGALDDAAVAELVRDRTGGPAPAGLVRRLAERTGGNPFFLTELLADPGRAEPPPSVRDAVRLRLAEPGPDARDCLDLLAVAGRELDLHLLGAAAGTDAARLLATPPAAHLVVEAGPGAVRYRHPLFAEVAYAELAPPRRATLHARLADAAAGLPRPGGLTPAELAHHYGQSAGLGRAEAFLRWTLVAAEEATRRLAYEDALGHLGRAADRLAGDALRAPAAAEAELAVQLHRAGLLQITAGVGSDAVDAAAARARTLLPLLGPDADLRAALWTLGELACNRAEFAVAEDLADRLGHAARSGAGLVGAAAPYLLGVVRYFTGRLGEADTQLSLAADRLRELDPRRLRGELGRTPPLAAHNFRALVRSLRGDAAAARADLAAARELAERAGDPYGLGNAALYTAWTALQEHDAEAGLAAARECRELGERRHMPHFVTVGQFVAGWAAVHLGDPGRLPAMHAAGGDIYRRGLRSTRTITLAAMAGAYLVAGDRGRAATLAAKGLAVAESAGELVLAAELLRVRGLARGRADDVRQGAALAERQGARLLLDRISRT